MTHVLNTKFRLKFVCLFSFLSVVMGVFFVCTQALACECYDGDKLVIVSGTAQCIIDCNDDDAMETNAGICNCPATGELPELDCTAVCIAENASYTTQKKSDIEYAEKGYIEPELEVEIPGVYFSRIVTDGEEMEINWLGEYITGVYTYLLSIAAIISIVIIMIGGLQYAFAGGHGETGKAKKRIKDAVIGLVLLFFVYFILWVVNPNTTFFDAIRLTEVDELELDMATRGFEGAKFGSLPRPTCDAIVAKAKDHGECKIAQSVTSPVGGAQPSCGNHHWFDYGANGDYKKIRHLDWGAGWGSSVYAPFDGIVTYAKQEDTNNKCGNRIYLEGTGDAAGAYITICHAKDFVNDSGAILAGQAVSQGDIIGHVGGRCCDGQTAPAGWATAKYGWCNVEGTPCTDPNKLENCDCQVVEQSGNTSGPHVHMSWKTKGGHLLACLDY